MKKVACCLLLVFPLLSQAKTERILEITAESEPGLVAEMSLDLDDESNHILNLLYVPDTKEKDTKIYTLEKLLKTEVTLKDATALNVKVIGLKLSEVNKSEYKVILNYLKSGSLFSKTYNKKELKVNFSSPDNRFLVTDQDTKKQISKLHFLSHFNKKGKVNGIEKIESQ